jgi:hypothetical protein
MANKFPYALETPNRHEVRVVFNFASGAAEDDTFPTGDDGYENIYDNDYDADGYGSRYEVFRTGKGTYHLILRDQFERIVRVSGEVVPSSDEVLIVVPEYPLSQSLQADGYAEPQQTRVILKILNTSAARTDLGHDERVTGEVVLNNAVVDSPIW